jgi:IgA Peptidase M64
MPITRIFWDSDTSSNQDIHVLRGQKSRDLTRDGLRFIDDPAGTDSDSARHYLNHHNDVVLTFQPRFKGALSAGGIFSGLNIDVDTSTGVVSPKAAAGRNNFIVEAIAKTPAPANKVIATETIRVHVHTSVSKRVLTPKTLTVRPAAPTRTDSETTNYRFALRALFDDGTMGDLTENHGVTWSSNPPDHVDDDTGQLIVMPGDAVDNTIEITATLPPALGGGTAKATLRIGQAWQNDPAMPKTTIVVGGGWPGTTLPDKAPNILILSDGFTSTVADKQAFESAVTIMVTHLKNDSLVRPYNILCTSMNFWHTFVPANTTGASIRCEIRTLDQPDGSKIGKVVPPPEKPPEHGEWDVEHLIYIVGLPVAAEFTTPIDDLRNQVWPPLADIAIPGPAILDDDVIKKWRRLATRTFVEELDNFPGMALGAPPAANTKSGPPKIALHPFRCTREGLNVFLKLLQSDNGVQFGAGLSLGTVWSIPARADDTDYAVGDFIIVFDNPGRAFICTSPGNSDSDEPDEYADAADGVTVTDGTASFRAVPLWFDNGSFVAVLSSFPGGRARNVRRTNTRMPYVAIAMDSGTPNIPLGPPSTPLDPGFSLNFPQAPPDVSVETARVFAHELGHSFGLGDEYVDFDREYPFGSDGVDDLINLQAEVDAQTNGKIEGANIRWNWHRIRKAAVVTGAPTSVNATTFRFPVILGQGLQFATGDTVLLRRRRAGQLLADASAVRPGGPLVVVAPKAADTVDVQAAPGVTITLADLQRFIPGSILFLPVQAPASVRSPAYPFAEMVAKNVKDLITQRHDVLFHQAAGDARTDDIKEDKDIQHPDLDGLTPALPAGFIGKDRSRIVGLYEGGDAYANGVFHATGRCVMRNPHVGSNEFCPVCRYIMVDFINPFRHFEIDLDYDKIYPLK